jgi:hypothetical protein
MKYFTLKFTDDHIEELFLYSRICSNRYKAIYGLVFVYIMSLFIDFWVLEDIKISDNGVVIRFTLTFIDAVLLYIIYIKDKDFLQDHFDK